MADAFTFDSDPLPEDDSLTTSQRIGKLISPAPSEVLPYPRAAAMAQANPGRFGATSQITPEAARAATINAAGPGQGASLQPAAMPSLPAPALPNVIAPRGTVAGDTAELNRLENTGPGVNRIKRPWLRNLAKVGDAAESIVFPGIARFTPGTTIRHNMLLGQTAARLREDQANRQSDLNAARTQAETGFEQAQAGQQNAQASRDIPVPLSPRQAAAIGQAPGLLMSPRQYSQALTDFSRKQASLATNTGGQMRTLSSTDAAALGHPEWSGMRISNDEFQRQMAAHGHDVQSGRNTTARNRTAIQATGMRDATSRRNADERNLTSIGNNKRDNLQRQIDAQLRGGNRNSSASADGLSSTDAQLLGLAGGNGEASQPDGSSAHDQGSDATAQALGIAPAEIKALGMTPAEIKALGPEAQVSVKIPGRKKIHVGPIKNLPLLQEIYGDTIKVVGIQPTASQPGSTAAPAHQR